MPPSCAASSDFATDGLVNVFQCTGLGALVRRTGLGVYDVVFDDGGSDLDVIGVRFDLLGRTPLVTSRTSGVTASLTGLFQCSFSPPPDVNCYRVETRDAPGNFVEANFSIAVL